MAEFNAGSIVGSLDIHLDPFQAGLDKAAVEADEFQAKHGVNARADLDTAGFDDGAARVTAETDALSKEKAEVKVDADTAAATAKMALFKHSVDDASGASGGGHGMLYLIGLAASLAPALAPGIAAAGLFGSAVLAGAAQAGIGLGAFLAVAKSDFADLQKAIKKGTQLSGPAGEAENALKAFDKAWKEVKKDTAGPVFGVITAGLKDAAGLLPKIEPLVVAVAHGLAGALVIFDRFFNSKGFEQFLAMIEQNAIPDIKALASTFVNFAEGFMNLIEGLNPITQIFVGSIGNVSKEFLSWSEQMKNGGIATVFAYIKQYGPEIGQLLHAIFGLIGNLGRALAPLVGPALLFLTTLARALGGLNLAPLATALGSLLKVLAPVLTMLGGLINVILPPLSRLIGTLVSSFIGPLVTSLGANLNPVLVALGGFLDQLVAPLGAFLGSLANLVNPTGVGFLSALIVGLLQAVEPLIQPVFALATALESLVDDGVAAITPLLPGMTAGLTDVSKAIAPVIGWLAKILQYRPVVDVLLGIAGAAYAVKAAMKGLEIIEGIVTAFNTMRDAAILDTVALKAMYVWEGFLAAATKAWEIVQIIMDGVMAIFDAELWTAVAAELIAAAPFILIAAAVALVVVGIIELVKHWSTVWDWIKKIGEYLGGAFAAAWHKTVDFFKALGSDIKGFFVGAGKWLYGIGTDIVHGLLTGVEWYARILFDWYVKLPWAIIKLLVGADKWLFNIGWNVIVGFWNGMIAIFGKVESWVKSAFGGLGKIASGVLGIFSPSRVFAQLGTYTAMGFHEGYQHHFEKKFLPYLKASMSAAQAAVNTGIAGDFTLTTNTTQKTAAATEQALHDLVRATIALRQQNAALPAQIGVAVGEPLKQTADTIAKSNEANHNSVKEAFVAASNSSTDKIISAVRKR